MKTRRGHQPSIDEVGGQDGWRGVIRAVQIFMGHGCFGDYLCHIGREEDACCHHCDANEDTAQHTLKFCPAWMAERRVRGEDRRTLGLLRAVPVSPPLRDDAGPGGGEGVEVRQHSRPILSSSPLHPRWAQVDLRGGGRLLFVASASLRGGPGGRVRYLGLATSTPHRHQREVGERGGGSPVPQLE